MYCWHSLYVVILNPYLSMFCYLRLGAASHEVSEPCSVYGRRQSVDKRKDKEKAIGSIPSQPSKFFSLTGNFATLIFDWSLIVGFELDLENLDLIFLGFRDLRMPCCSVILGLWIVAVYWIYMLIRSWLWVIIALLLFFFNIFFQCC